MNFVTAVNMADGSYTIAGIPDGWTGSLSYIAQNYDLWKMQPTASLSPMLSDQVQDWRASYNPQTQTHKITGHVHTSSGQSSLNTITIVATGSGAFANQNFSNSVSAATGDYLILGIPHGWTGSLSYTSPHFTLVESPSVTLVSPVVSDQVQNWQGQYHP